MDSSSFSLYADSGIFENVITFFQEMITFLQEILRIESYTYSESALAARVVQEMQQLGFDAAWTDQTGNALGLVRGRERGAATMLLTHLDHIATGDLALWKYPPFAGVLENSVLHGRGAVDIKGPLAAHIYTLGAMLRVGKRPKHDCLVAIPVQEETGGYGMAKLLERLPIVTPLGDLELGACLVGEPSHNQIMLGHRGVCRCTLRFHGRAHHASLGLWQENPHFVYAEFLRRLERIPLFEHPILGRSSISPTVLSTDTSSNNLTPNTITLTLDWRTVTETGSDVRNTLGELTKNLPISYDSFDDWTSGVGGIKHPGFVTEPQHPLVVELHQTRDKHLGASETGIWQFATDGRWAHKVGIPCVGFGPGNQLFAHTTEEQIGVSELEQHVLVLQDFLLDW
ncbi:MAG: M20 family metallopeptidase [Deinococcales bacterium]